MISRRVPAGTNRPTITSASWSEKPSSAMVGTSGSSGERRVLVMASGRSLPARNCGTPAHIIGELFKLQTGVRTTHVPYSEFPRAISDLLQGVNTYQFIAVAPVLGFIHEGKLRALAVTPAKRMAALPNVPTLAEAGVKGVDVYSWQAVVAPKGLPADIKAKMHEALVAALNDAKVRQQFVAVGFEVVGNTPEQFAAFQQRENARWKQLIEQRKITAD